MNAITLTTKIILISLTSCSAMMPLADDIEKIATNDAIIIKVDKDAFAKDTDVNISVDVLNKESASIPPGVSIPAAHY